LGRAGAGGTEGKECPVASPSPKEAIRARMQAAGMGSLAWCLIANAD